MKIREMKYGKERRIELLYEDKYKDYKYYILNLGTHPTADIEIPKGHKLYEKSYDEIYELGCDIDVHGGFTYSAHNLLSIESENWFIGWDYAHCNDYYAYDGDIPESINTHGKKWTTEEIIEECKYVIDQIIDFENKESKEKKIPEKLKIRYKDNETLVNEKILQEDINDELANKINEIIDYIKSKGE